MISGQTLTYLVANKLKDARTLIQNGRFPTSIYLAGYAVEIALKRRICQTLQFNMGFPETRQELQDYLTRINRHNTQALIIHLYDIRNHDLNKLLFYSGVELRIKNILFNEWTVVNRWNPESRYRKIRIIRKVAEAYFEAARKITQEIN
jgi:hypothetical protein